MTTSISGARLVKSWLGLGLGLFAVVVSLAAWFESGNWAHLASAAGFGCWAIVWSQVPLSLTAPLRAQLAEVRWLGHIHSGLAWLGLLLVGLAILSRWLP